MPAKMRLNTAAAVQDKWNVVKDLFVVAIPTRASSISDLFFDDNPKRMPKGADPLSKRTTRVDRAVDQRGAELKIAAAASAPAAAEAKTKPPEPAKLPEVAAAAPEAIESLPTPARASCHCSLVARCSTYRSPAARSGRGRGYRAVGRRCRPGVCPQFGRCKLTDAGLAPLAALKNLTSLHMERSNVTDNGLAHVGALPQLQYLNVYRTPSPTRALRISPA